MRPRRNHETGADLGLTGRIVVGTTGAMVPHTGIEGPTKGQRKLIKAVGLLKDKHPDLRVLLVRDGPARAYVDQAARDAGVADRVVFAGRCCFDISEMLIAVPSLSVRARHRQKNTLFDD